MASPISNTSDQQVFAALVRAHGSAVLGYLRALVRREDDAEDLLQEVFRRAWQARGRYADRGTPRAYLLRIADHLVIDRYRAQAPEVNLDTEQWRSVEPSRQADPALSFEQLEARAQLTAALELLTPLQRRVLLLRFYGDLSFAEIATVVACPLNTTLSHCRRGLLALRKHLAQNAPEL